jgi:hypothetical protein
MPQPCGVRPKWEIAGAIFQWDQRTIILDVATPVATLDEPKGLTLLRGDPINHWYHLNFGRSERI